jgi:hypothetical protein
MLLRDQTDFRNLERSKIAQSQIHKFAFFVKLVDSFERLLERHAPVRRMKIEYIHSIALKLSQTRLQRRL